MKRAALIALASLLVGACATAPPRPQSPAPPGITATAFVAGAAAMLGRPYRYGGADPSGFDCSGLVHFAAAGVGLQLPRTAQELLGTGTPVRREALAGGDLVFMHLTAKELHVGIAVDGARFVHAPSTGGRVRIDSLDTAPYREGFFAARRLDFPP